MGILTFIKKEWVNNSAPAITATELNRIEDGINNVVNEINSMKVKDFTNFDESIEQAEYRVIGENLVNAPYVSVISGKLIVIVSNGATHDSTSTIWQYFNDKYGKEFYRYKDGINAWSSWYQEYSSQYKPTATDVGLGNVNNTSDLSKPISTLTQTALNDKVPITRTINSKPLSANILLVAADVSLGNVNNTSDTAKPISIATQTALDGKVPITRTINTKALSTNITLLAADVGLGNVNNTSDAAKPVSTATQTALNGKAQLIASATTYGGIKISNVSGVLKIYT